MQRWEYKVVSLRDQQYTAALNEFGAEGWELISVITEAIETPPAPVRGRGIPMPRALGRLEEAADKLTKIGDSEADAASEPTSRLLWVFRRPSIDD
jgi:hypothetical protein